MLQLTVFWLVLQLDSGPCNPTSESWKMPPVGIVHFTCDFESHCKVIPALPARVSMVPG